MPSSGMGAARWFAGTALAVVVAWAVSACSHQTAGQKFGSAYSSSSTNYRDQMAALQAQSRTAAKKGPSAELTVYRHMLATTQSTLSRLSALHPSAGAQRTYDQLVASLKIQATSLNKVLTAVAHHDDFSVNAALHTYAVALQNGLSLQQQLDATVGLARGPTSG